MPLNLGPCFPSIGIELLPKQLCACGGHFEEYFYNGERQLTETIDMAPGGVLVNIPAGQWHSLRSLESGTVLLECKDGPWVPLGEEDLLVL